MKALVYTGLRKVKFTTVPKPKIKKNQDLIKVLAAGICGSDLHAFNGLDKIKKKPPIILGHEVSGINLKNNKPVVINPIITCKKCKNCRSKNENLCTNLAMIGMSKPIKRQGGFADFLNIPKKNIFTISNKSKMYEAALTEPTAVALHAVNLSSLHLKDDIKKANIIIIGGGSIGLLTSIILKNKNINNITLLDTNYIRLKECRKYSNAIVSHPNSKKIKNNSYNIVFDAVGSIETRRKSLELISKGGIIIHIGLTQNEGGLDFLKLTRDEITFVGSYAYSNKEFKKSLSMILKNELGDLSWVDFAPLKDGQIIFNSINQGKTKYPKTILIP